MDQQNLSGLGFLGGMYEIKKGKRVSRCGGPGSATGFLFRAPELWKNITAIGGACSFMRYPLGKSVKGEPPQTVRYSVGAVPAVVKNVALVDVRRGR
jgi:hypothetical protein